MNRKISTARKNKTDIIKPKTPARQGNWNKQKNKQTINPLYEEQYHTTTTTTTTTTDLPRWMDSIELLFLHLPTLKPTLRMNYIRARGIDDEDFKSSQSPSSHRTTNSLSRAISTATSQHRQEEKQNLQKVNSINALDLFFFQFRVYSRCFNTIRILYTLFLRVNTFWLLTLCFFFLFLPGQNRQMDEFMYY